MEVKMANKGANRTWVKMRPETDLQKIFKFFMVRHISPFATRYLKFRTIILGPIYIFTANKLKKHFILHCIMI